MFVIDASVPLSNKTFCYRPEWRNSVKRISSTNEGHNSTVFRYDLCSHSGTYVETSQHKLPNHIVFDDFPLSCFVRAVEVVKIPLQNNRKVTVQLLKQSAQEQGIDLEQTKALVILTGWCYSNYEHQDFLVEAPYYCEELTEYLCSLKLDLLGVDTPVIDNLDNSYNPVNLLFNANPNMLLVAPLCIDLDLITQKQYILNCLPLSLEGVSASLCRAVLIGT